MKTIARDRSTTVLVILMMPAIDRSMMPSSGSSDGAPLRTVEAVAAGSEEHGKLPAVADVTTCRRPPTLRLGSRLSTCSGKQVHDQGPAAAGRKGGSANTGSMSHDGE